MPLEAEILPHLSEGSKKNKIVSNSDQSHEDNKQDHEAKRGQRKGGGYHRS